MSGRVGLARAARTNPGAVVAASLLLGAYLPFAFLGPGTDIDTAGVYRAGAAILDGDYVVSRTPGAPVFEAATGVLHSLGGSLLVNLVSILMAGVAAVSLTALLAREGVRHAAWFGVAVLANPFVWVAGTSMVDFVWATALALLAANLQLARRDVPAALLYAAAIGCRLSTGVLVVAFVVAEAVAADRGRRRELARLALGVVALAALVFLPPFATMGLEFLRSDVPSSTLLVQVGRFGVKNAFFFGPVVLAGLAGLAPRLARSLRAGWASSVLLRAGVLGFVGVELLFLRFPWKLAHLIPAWLCLLAVLGAARVLSHWMLAVLVTAQLVLGLVNVNLAEPDRPNEATGGSIAVSVVDGPLLRDLRCRLDAYRDAYRDPEAQESVLATWDCVLPWSE